MKLFICAGGTGGHIFPGIAVAEALMAIGSHNEAVFIGTPNGLEKGLIPKYGYRLYLVASGQFSGKNPLYKTTTLLKLIWGIFMCASLIKRERPDAILGMGGFASVPCTLAGIMLRVPIFLHEQNVEPGLANRLLSRFAKAIFISFKETEGYLNGKGKSIVHTGNPIRKTVKVKGPWERHDSRFSIFVFGGSRGARRINDAVIELLSLIERPKAVLFYHQTGRDDYERVAKAYEESGIDHEVFPFTDEMGRYYTISDLVISRAGASTIFELAYFKKAAIIIPYPFSAGQHQWKNAAYIEGIGGCYLMGDHEATGETLYEVLRRLINEPGLIKRMGENIGRVYVDDPEKRIIEVIAEHTKGKEGLYDIP